MIDIEKLAQDMFGTVLVNGKEYYEIDSEEWKNLAEAYAAKVLEDKERETAELKEQIEGLIDSGSAAITALKANVNDLREALQSASNYVDKNSVLGKLIASILLKTPAQNPQEFENEVIEICAEEVDERGSRFEAENIRALKKE